MTAAAETALADAIDGGRVPWWTGWLSPGWRVASGSCSSGTSRKFLSGVVEQVIER